MDEKHEDRQRRLNTGAHLQRAATAMAVAANAATWEDARSHVRAAGQALRNAAASIMGP